jgi:hypothetical protein
MLGVALGELPAHRVHGLGQDAELVARGRGHRRGEIAAADAPRPPPACAPVG